MNAGNKILLIRHCKPEIDYSKCNYVEATKRIYEYNTTQEIAIEEILPLKSHIQEFLETKNLSVFTSSMPRALITAQALFNKYDIIGEDRFVEFDLHFVQIPFIKLKFGTWALISRILWFCRILKTTRPIRAELNRANDAGDFLYEESKKSNIALVSHGMLNMFIEKRLKKLGYTRASKEKNGFFSIVTLEYNANNYFKH